MKKIAYGSTALILALVTIPGGRAGADEPVCKKDAAATVFIQGRIEETATASDMLPVRLTRLKSEQPIPDEMPASPEKPLQGEAVELGSRLSSDSFPEEMVGLWAGRLTIVSEYHKPGLTVEPERQLGQSGVAVFHFIQDGSRVILKPATVFLPPVVKPLKETRFSSEAFESMEEKATTRGVPVDPEKLVRRNPIISLGSYSWVKLDGSHRTSSVTANTIHNLAQGVVEQDLVDKLETQTAEGQNVSSYAEVVCRFKRTGSDSQFVQVARIFYAVDRSISRRIVLEGNLSSNWQPYADEISGQVRRPWEAIVQKHNI
jgi:hypothetical protein